MGYFLYTRKSQEDEGRQVQSIPDQLRIGRQLAQSRGLPIVAEFEETKSAKRPGRPIFNRMVQRLENGEADGVIAWHPDRLSRNGVDAGVILDLLDRGRLLDLKFDSYTFENTPEGKWMLGIVLGQAKYTVDKLSKDVSRGIQSKLAKGHFPHRALPGYRNNKAQHTIEADPERFELIQRAMKLVATGAYSVPEVLDILNRQWGFRTRQTEKTGGRPLSRTTFYDMLSNVFYTGQMKHDGTIWPGKHPAMLTQHEFDRIQQVISHGSVTQRHQPTVSLPAPLQRREFDYTGFIRCKRCGCLVTAETKVKQYIQTGRTRTYTYYHCTNGKGGCSKQSVSEEWIKAQILALLERITPHPQFVRWYQEHIKSHIPQEAKAPHQGEDFLKRSLANAKRRKSNLLDDRFANPHLLTPEEFREQKEKMQAEINALEQELRRIEEKAEVVRQSVENVFDFAFSAKSNFERGGPKVKKEIALRLGQSYFLTLEKLEIVLHPLLVPILTIEPPESGSGSKKDGGFDTFRPSWLAIPDQIRNLIVDQNLSFEKVEWPLKAPS